MQFGGANFAIIITLDSDYRFNIGVRVFNSGIQVTNTSGSSNILSNRITKYNNNIRSIIRKKNLYNFETLGIVVDLKILIYILKHKQRITNSYKYKNVIVKI